MRADLLFSEQRADALGDSLGRLGDLGVMMLDEPLDEHDERRERGHAGQLDVLDQLEDLQREHAVLPLDGRLQPGGQAGEPVVARRPGGEGPE